MKPQHYCVEPGTLFAGEYPGDRNHAVARERIRFLAESGIRVFIDLTTRLDRLAPYDEVLTELTDETGWELMRISLPIPDMGIPESAELTRTILATIRESIDRSPAAYIHCWGGIGRTGTVIGCWLRERGMEPDEALQRVQHLYSTQMPKVARHPESPQTAAQKDYIRRWEAAG